MGAIDISTLLLPVSDDAPAGEDLEYDLQFAELERAAQGKEARSVGDSVIEAEPADWKTVESLAKDLLGKSKDLRLAAYLARAALNLHGVGGFADALHLMRQMMETYWDTLHPQLDPDDDNDPTFRINTLITLNDRSATLNSLERVPLVSSKMMGRFSLRDIKMALGDIPTPDDIEQPSIASIDAAFMDADIEAVQYTVEALKSAQENLTAIDVLLMEKVGASQCPDMSGLERTLKEAQALVAERLSQRGGGVEEVSSEMVGSGAPGNAPSVASSVSGEILSREDAARYMDKIATYFEKNEPSSPVPLMMRRAKRLATMNFMDILREMAPGGLGEAEHITGVNNEE